MLQSKLFTKTRKEVPADEVSRSAELLIRGGFINKEMAGVYDYLPLGLRVLKKIENIIRQEMDAIGGQEIIMSSLQRQELWQKHFNQDRWDDAKVDIWFKTKLRNELRAKSGIMRTREFVMKDLYSFSRNEKEHLIFYEKAKQAYIN